MKLEDCQELKIGDKVKVKGICDSENPAVIVKFDYKAIWYRYLGDEAMEPKKAMYYDIIGEMTEEEIKSAEEENKRAKNFKMPKCPDCKKPIDKCKCTE